MKSILNWRAAIIAGLVLSGTHGAQAQDQPQGPQGTGATETQPPTPPGMTQPEELQASLTNPEVETGVGVGSEIAYASAGVVELGGSLALAHASDTTIFRIAPSVGYFPADNLELTLFPELSITDVSGETDFILGVMLEPSYHVPFSERFFGFLGIGIGLRYADDPGFDFALRPRIGVDIMVGRSGILKPAAFLDIGTNDGLTQGGFEASFTVML